MTDQQTENVLPLPLVPLFASVKRHGLGPEEEREFRQAVEVVSRCARHALNYHSAVELRSEGL